MRNLPDLSGQLAAPDVVQLAEVLATLPPPLTKVGGGLQSDSTCVPAEPNRNAGPGTVPTALKRRPATSVSGRMVAESGGLTRRRLQFLSAPAGVPHTGRAVRASAHPGGSLRPGALPTPWVPGRLQPLLPAASMHGVGGGVQRQPDPVDDRAGHAVVVGDAHGTGRACPWCEQDRLWSAERPPARGLRQQVSET